RRGAPPGSRVRTPPSRHAAVRRPTSARRPASSRPAGVRPAQARRRAAGSGRPARPSSRAPCAAAPRSDAAAGGGIRGISAYSSPFGFSDGSVVAPGIEPLAHDDRVLDRGGVVVGAAADLLEAVALVEVPGDVVRDADFEEQL